MALLVSMQVCCAEGAQPWQLPLLGMEITCSQNQAFVQSHPAGSISKPSIFYPLCFLFFGVFHFLCLLANRQMTDPAGFSHGVQDCSSVVRWAHYLALFPDP